MKTVDLIVKNVDQLVTCASEGQPKRGREMRDVGIIEQGAMAIDAGKLIAVGDTKSILDKYRSDNVIDATGQSIIPGLVDCHTHVPHGGNRYDEFEMRIQGRSYMEIMQAGGGIMHTVRQTRLLSLEELTTLTEERLHGMMALGTTTAELKTGYGLSTSAETKQMQVICGVAKSQPVRIVSTFLGAHTKPPEYDTADAYLEILLEDTLPAVQSICDENDMLPFVDIFVEDGVFSVAQMQRFFEVASQHGLPLKAHLDQFANLGGVPIAVAMDAVSVDHLEVTPSHELDHLAQSNTVGVMLPTVNFNLGISDYGNARHLIDANGILALATDYNPGSSPTISLPFVMALACRFQKLLPAEALNACTINAAFALQKQTDVGSLEVGKWADFLILESNDYRAMIVEFGRNVVEKVFIGGKPVWMRSS